MPSLLNLSECATALVDELRSAPFQVALDGESAVGYLAGSLSSDSSDGEVAVKLAADIDLYDTEIQIAVLPKLVTEREPSDGEVHRALAAVERPGVIQQTDRYKHEMTFHEVNPPELHHVWFKVQHWVPLEAKHAVRPNALTTTVIHVAPAARVLYRVLSRLHHAYSQHRAFAHDHRHALAFYRALTVVHIYDLVLTAEGEREVVCAALSLAGQSSATSRNMVKVLSGPHGLLQGGRLAVAAKWLVEQRFYPKKAPTAQIVLRQLEDFFELVCRKPSEAVIPNSRQSAFHVAAGHPPAGQTVLRSGQHGHTRNESTTSFASNPYEHERRESTGSNPFA